MKVSLGKVFTAMVTPFHQDMSVNYDMAQKLSVHLVNNGSDGLVISGTTGESPTLTSEEKLSLFKAVKEAVGDRATIVAGTGNYCTDETKELTRHAEQTGVDACMLVVPYYNKPPQEGLYRHFKAAAENTTLPVILYNVPSRTACNLEAETVVRLSEVPNIVAVKEASGNFGQVSEIVDRTPDDFVVYSGQDEWNLPVLALGGTGVISVASHIVGNEIAEMVRAHENGQANEALNIHLRLLPLFRALFWTTNPIMVKAAVRLLGFDVGPTRLPLVPADEGQVTKLSKLMGKMGLV